MSNLEGLITKRDLLRNINAIGTSAIALVALTQAAILDCHLYAHPESAGGKGDFNMLALLLNKLQSAKTRGVASNVAQFMRIHGPYTISYDSENKTWKVNLNKGDKANPFIGIETDFADYEAPKKDKVLTALGMTKRAGNLIKDIATMSEVDQALVMTALKTLIGEYATAKLAAIAKSEEVAASEIVEPSDTSEDSSEELTVIPTQEVQVAAAA